jgi:Kdo2-lipid IVA lauroyltransferase/acyltransferase
MNESMLRARRLVDRVFLICSIRIIWLISRMLPYRLGVRAGGALGLACYYLLPRERKRTLAHLSLVFGGKGRPWMRRTARRCFIHLGKSLVEVMLMTPRRLERVVEFQGEEKLRAALAAGKGAIFVTGHIGNWELLAHAVASRFPLSVIAAPIEPESVNDLIVALRGRMGVRTVLRGRPGAVREMIRIFRERGILGLLIDQDTDVESVFVDFMGLPAKTPVAAASIAVRFGAPVVFGHIQRYRGDRHRIVIEGPLTLVDTGAAEKDLKTNTAMLSGMIENCIRARPEQWVWMHRRWRSRQ